MDECKHHDEFVKEIKQFHLEIKDRLARIETKQDSARDLNNKFQTEFNQLYLATSKHDKDIAALNSELLNLKWTAGVMAGLVTGFVQILFYIFRGK